MKRALFLYFLFLLTKGYSQRLASIHPLSIGDTVPDMELHHLVNYKTPSAKLSDFRGKLVILDFWATWCSACIGNFPKMEGLEKEFNGRLQVFGVTKENEFTIKKFLETKKDPDGNKYTLASIVSDSVFSKLFPHRFIPHFVWIGQDGIVKAITSMDEISKDNVEKLFSKRSQVLEVKKDLEIKRPLFLSEDYPDKNELLYYSILSNGNYNGLGSGNRFIKKGSIVYGRAVTNSGILNIYEAAISPIFFGQYRDSYTKKRLILDVKDSNKVIITKLPNGAWDYSAEYNFDIVVPLKEADSLYSYMLADLNRYSGFYGRIEKRKVKCFVLIHNVGTNKLKTAGQKANMQLYQKPVRLVNTPFKQLLIRLNIEEIIPLPVLDETNYTGNVDMELSGNFDLPTLRKELNLYGLELIETEREMNMFVLSDKQVSNSHSKAYISEK